MRNVSPFACAIPIFFILIGLPLVVLLHRLNGEGLMKTFSDPAYWWSAANSLLASFLAALICLILAISLGFFEYTAPHSWPARMFRWLADLPMALPHTVAGLALLLTFGKNSSVWPEALTMTFSFSGVVVAMVFTSFSAMVRAIGIGLGDVDHEVFHMARSLGDSEERAYLRIVVAQLWLAASAGMVLTAARSIGEFAAVALVGGNVPGSTQVLASYVFVKIETGDLDMAVSAGASALFLSLLLAAGLRAMGGARYA